MLDSSCQLNLANGSTLPSFYWESTTYRGSSIEGTPVPLNAKAESFPMKFNETSNAVTWYKLDNIKEDCILGSEFLARVSPFSFDIQKMLFSYVINNCTVKLPLSFSFSLKCQSFVQKPVKKVNTAQLMKMHRCIAFSDIHGEKALADITAKLIKYCCSEIPNDFWTREKYLVSLSFDPLQKIKPMKASACLMSPSERDLRALEIKELLAKGLIEPSKSPWAC